MSQLLKTLSLKKYIYTTIVDKTYILVYYLYVIDRKYNNFYQASTRKLDREGCLQTVSVLQWCVIFHRCL